MVSGSAAPWALRPVHARLLSQWTRVRTSPGRLPSATQAQWPGVRPTFPDRLDWSTRLPFFCVFFIFYFLVNEGSLGLQDLTQSLYPPLLSSPFLPPFDFQM